MKVLHVSDTHVGYSAYHRIAENGLNQREQDVYDAFTAAVDVALEHDVDAVVHSGDLFDSVRPTNRAVTFVMEELQRLSDAGIPTIVISGNHETPKMRETGSVLRFLGFLPHVHPIYKGRREVVEVDDLAVHAVPHTPTQEALEREVMEAEPLEEARWNILTLHAGILGVGDFRTGEFNELTLPASLLGSQWDYIALGHYHRHTQVTENAWYGGSTERTSFNEAGEEKGVVILDLDAGTRDLIPLDTRPMLRLEPLDCEPLSEVEIPPAVYRRLKSTDTAGALLRWNVRNIPRHVYASLDFERIRRLTSDAVHAHVDFDLTDDDRTLPTGGAHIGSLRTELEAFLQERPMEELDRDRLRAQAVSFLEEGQGG